MIAKIDQLMSVMGLFIDTDLAQAQRVIDLTRHLSMVD